MDMNKIQEWVQQNKVPAAIGAGVIVLILLYILFVGGASAPSAAEIGKMVNCDGDNCSISNVACDDVTDKTVEQLKEMAAQFGQANVMDDRPSDFAAYDCKYDVTRNENTRTVNSTFVYGDGAWQGIIPNL